MGAGTGGHMAAAPRMGVQVRFVEMDSRESALWGKLFFGSQLVSEIQPSTLSPWTTIHVGPSSSSESWGCTGLNGVPQVHVHRNL